MKDKIIVSSLSLVASLVSYFYANQYHKDPVPYMMIGGFIGVMIGETIVTLRKKDEGDTEK